MTTKIVVTGGEGFIGSNLIEALVAIRDESGAPVFEVHSIDNRVRENMRIVGANYHTEDICDLSALKQVFLRADAVFHMAALPRVQDTIDDPLGTALVNELGTINVLEAARYSKVRRVVFSSTSAIYGNGEVLPYEESMKPSPLSPYAVHKLAGEAHCRLYADIFGVETVSLRYFNVYGPRLDPDGPYALVVGIFLKQKKAGKPLTVTGDGLQTRDFIHVWDVVKANIAAAEFSIEPADRKVGKGEVMNIGTGVGVAVNGIASLIAGSGGEVEYIPPRLEPKHGIASINRAQELLGFVPHVGIAAGIAMVKKEWGIE